MEVSPIEYVVGISSVLLFAAVVVAVLVVCGLPSWKTIYDILTYNYASPVVKQTPTQSSKKTDTPATEVVERLPSSKHVVLRRSDLIV